MAGVTAFKNFENVCLAWHKERIRRGVMLGLQYWNVDMADWERRENLEAHLAGAAIEQAMIDCVNSLASLLYDPVLLIVYQQHNLWLDEMCDYVNSVDHTLI